MKHRTVLRVVALAVCMLLAVAVFSACANQAPAQGDAPSSTSKTASEQPGESKAPEAVPYKIMFIPKNLGNPYFDAIYSGMQKAMEEVGQDKVMIDTTGPASAEATSQIEFVEAAVQNGYNAIFIAANSNDALNQTFTDARDKGVKIVVINGDIPGSEAFRDGAILPTDFSKVGSSLVECLGKLLNNKGKFAILSATTDAPDQNTWIEGMKEALKDPMYAEMELIDIVYGDDQPEKSATEMEALIAKYPDLNAVISPTSVGIESAARVIQTKKLSDKIVLTGLGLPSQLQAYIMDGTMLNFQIWQPVDEGYLAVYLGLALKDGLTFEEGSKFNVGKLGEYFIGKDGVIITSPLSTVSKENFDDFPF